LDLLNKDYAETERGEWRLGHRLHRLGKGTESRRDEKLEEYGMQLEMLEIGIETKAQQMIFCCATLSF
jgi:hypothetical protein